jgi:hypothetical protein
MNIAAETVTALAFALVSAFKSVIASFITLVLVVPDFARLIAVDIHHGFMFAREFDGYFGLARLTVQNAARFSAQMAAS